MAISGADVNAFLPLFSWTEPLREKWKKDPEKAREEIRIDDGVKKGQF